MQNNDIRLGYLIDDCYLLHDTGPQHPESAKRLVAIQQVLDTFAAGGHWQRMEPRPAHSDELQIIHHSSYIESIEIAAKRAPVYLDLDTVVSAQSYHTALLAAGGVLQCIDSICLGRLRRAFAFLRPPGHHAGYKKAMGFCLFNNVALAAAYARRKHKLERIAIIDIDLHHGNGTQDCFYRDPGVLYISSHQFPFYPGSGDFDEIGLEEGKGYNLNFPLREGSGDSIFVPIYSKIVSAVLDQFMPQLILVSAGFDGHFRDPMGELIITHAGYASAAASLILAAERCCEGKICFVLEGGYNLQSLQECSRAVMSEMEAVLPRELPLCDSSLFAEISSQAAKYAGTLWKWD